MKLSNRVSTIQNTPIQQDQPKLGVKGKVKDLNKRFIGYKQ